MYQLGQDPQFHQKGKRRKRMVWFIVLVILVAAGIVAVIIIRNQLKPATVIKQSSSRVTHVTYDTKTRRFDEQDFSIDIPATWQAVDRPSGGYQSFTWQTSEKGTNGQQIEIYEDTIPVNFAVNRVLIVDSQEDRLTVSGVASDNCSKYTRGGSTPTQTGASAKWQGIDFLCDQSNQQRDVIGTSSTDGINAVILKSPTTGISHKFFFTYTSNDATNPDYSPFYNALNSVRMK